jgi:pyruvate, water dikinase
MSCRYRRTGDRCPAIVGTINATDILRDGDEVTVSCAEGEIGHVYEGTVGL